MKQTKETKMAVLLERQTKILENRLRIPSMVSQKHPWMFVSKTLQSNNPSSSCNR